MDRGCRGRAEEIDSIVNVYECTIRETAADDVKKSVLEQKTCNLE